MSMTRTDLLRLAGSAVRAHRLRSLLTALGIAIGIAAVVLLTSIGEGIHRFVLAEFTQFGTTLLAVNPGKTTTHGTAVGVFGTTRPLTIEDAEALKRLPEVRAVEAVVAGNGLIEVENRKRRANVYGVGATFPEVFRFSVAVGRFLPADDPRAARNFAVLGSTLERELFGERNPLGAAIRVGGSRFRVIGVMRPKGQVLGFDVDDTVYIPTAKALELFDREGLMEIDVLYDPQTPPARVEQAVKRVLVARHGRDDFTLTTQEKMLDVLGSVLEVLTLAVGTLGGVSLLVGGVGILTIMTISVRERTAEIGLLRALGAERRQVLGLFLAEAVVLSLAGGGAGLLLGLGLALGLSLLLPALPVQIAWLYVAIALAVSAVVGLLAGLLPARHAARLDPVVALRGE